MMPASIPVIVTEHSRLLLFAVLLLSTGLRAQAAPTFADVAPVLQARCVVCHSGAAAPLGLKLDSLKGLRAGSTNGEVAIPGDGGQSELVRRLRGDSLPRMPLTGPPYLEPQQIALIEAWISAGMPAGDPVIAGAPASRPAPGEPVGYTDVAPIFLQRCVKCHSDNGIMGAPPERLRLGTHAQILAGGERLVVVSRAPQASRLVRRIRGLSHPRMPFDGPPYLSEEEIRLISDWVSQGAANEHGEPTPVPVGANIRLEGVLADRWQLDDLPLVVDAATRIRKNPSPGDTVEVRGVVTADGGVRATRIRKR